MIWKDIKGYEGYYQVNILGQVKSVPHWKSTGKNSTMYWTKERLMKPALSGKFKHYLFYHVRANKKSKTLYLHKLIAQYFIPNPNNLDEVNHINGIKTDNRIENLEWCTHAENIHHAVQNDLIHRGENNYNHRLTAEEVKAIRKDFRVQQVIADQYGVSHSLISAIKRRKTWKHV